MDAHVVAVFTIVSDTSVHVMVNLALAFHYFCHFTFTFDHHLIVYHHKVFILLYIMTKSYTA